MTAAPRITTGPIPVQGGGIAPLRYDEPWIATRESAHRDGSSTMVWLVGAHGGAGVSTLATMWPHAGDGGLRWPGVPSESPYCVLVARESMAGLEAAHLALRQYLTEGDIPSVLLGLILVPAGPGTRTSEVRRLRQTVVSLAPAYWNLPWLEQLLELPATALAQAPPDTVPVKRVRDLRQSVHPDIIRLGTELRDRVLAEHTP